jgi:hypothetical protein
MHSTRRRDWLSGVDRPVYNNLNSHEKGTQGLQRMVLTILFKEVI